MRFRAVAIRAGVIVGLSIGLVVGFDAPRAAAEPGVAARGGGQTPQGCHRPDGSGSEGTAPSLAGTVAKFLSVPGGREYLGRVPGVATSPLSDKDLAEVLNWMLWRFDSGHIPANFAPYTPEELGTLRTHPLRIEASRMRRDLLKRADRSLAR
jgi:hypothetical protein